jgi:hypothetical protein
VDPKLPDVATQEQSYFEEGLMQALNQHEKDESSTWPSKKHQVLFEELLAGITLR